MFFLGLCSFFCTRPVSFSNLSDFSGTVGLRIRFWVLFLGNWQECVIVSMVEGTFNFGGGKFCTLHYVFCKYFRDIGV